MVNVFTAIKNNYGVYLSRAAGVAALGLVARDAHVNGKAQADSYVKVRDGKAVSRIIENSMNTSNPSITKNKMQKFVLDFEVDHGFRGFVNSFVGYFKGLFKNLIYDVVPLTLGAMALFAKNAKVAKGSGIALAVTAVYHFLKDGLGIGKPKEISK